MTLLLMERLRDHAERTPFSPALVGLAGARTYQEVFRQVATVANYFDDRRIPRMARVQLNIGNPDLRLIVVMAALHYGLTILIAQSETLKGNLTPDLVVGSSEPMWPGVPADLVIDDAVLNGRFADPRLRAFPIRGDEELAWVSETSGTTGRPKLVAITYRRFRQRLQSDAPYKQTDRVFFSIPATSYHVMTQAMLALARGAAVLQGVLDTQVNLRLINLFNATYLVSTPAFIERALNVMEAENVTCQSVRDVYMTGAAPTADLLERIEAHFKSRVWVGYGTTEVGGIARGVVSASTYRTGFVGKINPQIKLTATGTRSNPGSIVIANDREHFTVTIVNGKLVEYDQPFYTVPDLGYLEDGVLYVTGRADEVYNFSGNLKAYSVIEEELRRLARLKDVAIVSGASVGQGGDLFIAIVAGRPLNIEDLSRQLVDRLHMAQALRHFRLFQVEAIPRNPETGKIDRGAVLAAYRERYAPAREKLAAREGVR